MSKELTLFEGGHPFSTADFSWLQLMMQESLATVLTTLLHGTADAAIVTGCVLEGRSTRITISDGQPGDWTGRKAGQVIYQGKIYDVLSGDVSGSFGMDAAAEVGLKIVLRANRPDYPSVFYANNVERDVYNDYVMELVTSGWDVPMAGLALVSNNAQSGTVVGFMPPAGSVLTDFVDPATNAGKGRWRGWRRLTEANGRVLVGLDTTQPEFDTIGETGGAKTHLLTAAQSGLREHLHKTLHTGSSPNVGDGGSGQSRLKADAPDLETATAGPLDALEAHNNLQPYLTTVWMIKL